MKVAANLMTMFSESGSLSARYRAAAAAGFANVECPDPYGIPPAQLATLKNDLGLQQVLINSPIGTLPGEERGIACHPGKEGDFIKGIHRSIEYAKALKCPKIHVLAGIPPTGNLTVTCEAVYCTNVKLAAETMLKEGITCLIEPINQVTIPGYFLASFDQAMRVLQSSNMPNLKILLDIFHAQQICGRITDTIRCLSDYCGHMQVAQVPHRHEPDSPGELDYAYVFKLLEEVGYDGFIGAEYIPLNGTVAGLGWIEHFGLEKY